MRRISQRLYWLWARLALLATTGVVFQTTGCSVVDTASAGSDFIGTLLQTLISSYVYDQVGAQSSMFF